MFGREFVLQCCRKSFRKNRCSLLLFFLWLCFWMSLVALLYSYFSINEILSLLLIKKKEWLPQKGFSGLKIYQGITTGSHKTGLWSSTIPPQIFHIPSSTNSSKALKLTNNHKKNPQSAPLDLFYISSHLLIGSCSKCYVCQTLRFAHSICPKSMKVKPWKKPTLILILTNPYWLLYCVINDYVLILQNAGNEWRNTSTIQCLLGRLLKII